MALTLALAVAGVIALAQGRAQSDGRRYRTETVLRGQVTGVLHLPATLIPTARIRVGTTEPARVQKVSVRVGDRVERGQVLARLESRHLRAAAIGAEASALAAQVGARQAQLKMAEIAYLLQKGHGAPADPEVASAALSAEIDLVNATAQLKRQAADWVIARDRLAGSVIRAPINGVIAERSIEDGETLPAGTPMFVIASDPTELELIAPVSEVDAARLRPGTVTFEVPAHPGRQFEADSDGAVEPAPASTGAPYRVRLHAHNPDGALASGMTARLELPARSAEGVPIVPAEAVAFSPAADSRATGQAVYVVAQGRPRRIAINTGVSDARRIEVREASLREDDEVIVGER
jgi:HlyD family secretion protein